MNISRATLAARKVRRDARNRLRIAGMLPVGEYASETEKKRAALFREIQSLNAEPLAIRVTDKTRWG